MLSLLTDLLIDKTDQVANIIISSGIYTVPEIAQVAGISEKE